MVPGMADHAFAMKTEILTTVKLSSRLVRENRELAETARSYAEAALAKDDYEAAEELSRGASEAARVVRDRSPMSSP